MSRRRILISSTSFICAQCRLHLNPRHSTARLLSTQIPPANKDESTSSLLHLLQSRGLINQIAAPGPLLSNLLSPPDPTTPTRPNSKPAFYAGIDPTAPSLHLGHLLPLMVLFWAAAHGFSAISLVGGATARVGDPSGRLTSREHKQDGVVGGDAERVRGQVGGLWGRAMGKLRRNGWEGGVEGQVLDNSAWLDGLGLLEFLGTMGRGVRVGAMLGRDTVRNKMEKGDGLSFAELTYPLLQAWDWWHMFSTLNVQIQVGGSDQYGNIVAGIDAVKFIAQNSHTTSSQGRGERPYWLDENSKLREDSTPMGLTVPLLTTSSGEKFGKSAGNAVWLDRSMTGPFDLYGFLLRTPDADISRYLQLLTFLPLPHIAHTMEQHAADPGQRIAQHLLATEILALVHGEDVATETRGEHDRMRNPSISTATSSASGGEGGDVVLPYGEVVGVAWANVLCRMGMAESRGEARRLMQGGAVYLASSAPSKTADGEEGSEKGEVQFMQIKDSRMVVRKGDLLGGRLLVRMGKWKVRVIEVVGGADTATAGEAGSEDGS